ncbi:hypothetical protein [Sporosarcina sp. SAFN-010]|uniref:hypothetical protein n=1 Tax=Sporosarcina sp. SAFN-010 TaxID=3387273 RepID=UPI003F7DDB60
MIVIYDQSFAETYSLLFELVKKIPLLIVPILLPKLPITAVILPILFSAGIMSLKSSEALPINPLHLLNCVSLPINSPILPILYLIMPIPLVIVPILLPKLPITAIILPILFSADIMSLKSSVALPINPLNRLNYVSISRNLAERRRNLEM